MKREREREMSMHHACTVYHGVHVPRRAYTHAHALGGKRAWLHTALHTAQVFTLLFGLFLLLFWSTMFIAYPRAGGTQLELVPCNSRAHYTYYASLYYDKTSSYDHRCPSSTMRGTASGTS